MWKPWLKSVMTLSSTAAPNTVNSVMTVVRVIRRPAQCNAPATAPVAAPMAGQMSTPSQTDSSNSKIPRSWGLQLTSGSRMSKWVIPTTSKVSPALPTAPVIAPANTSRPPLA